MNILLIFFILGATNALAQDNPSQTQLKEIQGRIEELNQWFSEKLKLKREWLEEIKRADLEVQQINKKISLTNKQLKDGKASLRTLSKERLALKNKSSLLSGSLAKQLRTAYKLRQSPPLKKLLEGESMDNFQRTMRFQRYFSEAIMKTLENYHASLKALDANDALAEVVNANILKSLKSNKTQTKKLQNKIAARKQLIQDLEEENEHKTTEYKTLEEQRTNLETLIKKLLQPKLDNSSNIFLSLAGSLPKPLKGKITKAYGEKFGKNSLISQGLEISAPTGTPAVAIYRGTVVFADWLRGFGLLLIIDHGGGYMSLYGNAEILHKSLGELVETGELVAEAGNSGARKETGIYFEIRHQGEAVDPLIWINND